MLEVATGTIPLRVLAAQSLKGIVGVYPGVL